MNVDTLFELNVLTTEARLKENEPEMVDISNIHNNHYLVEGMLIPLKRVECVFFVAKWIPSNTRQYDDAHDDFAFYHPHFISLIFGHGVEMDDFESDMPDRDTTPMLPMLQQLTKEAFIAMCEKINFTLYNPKMAEFIDMVDKCELNRLNETFDDVAHLRQTIDGHSSTILKMRREQVRLSLMPSDTYESRYSILYNSYLHDPGEEISEKSHFDEVILKNGTLDIMDDEVYERLIKKPHPNFYSEREIRRMAEGETVVKLVDDYMVVQGWVDSDWASSVPTTGEWKVNEYYDSDADDEIIYEDTQG